MAANWWPWLALAGAGALHGLNPAGGWAAAAAWALRSRQPARAWRALVPIAAGHLLSVAVVAALVALGSATDRRVLQAAAAVLLVGALLLRQRHPAGHAPARAGQAGLALWSFIVSTGHGAGLMLVPALAPLCLAEMPAREITASGSLALALAAVGVHLAAMLGATGLSAAVACRAAVAWRQAGADSAR